MTAVTDFHSPGPPGPFVVSAFGRSDLTVATIAITIGILLLWLRARLATAGHLVAGILLIAVPGALAGFRALTSGALGPVPPAGSGSASPRPA